MEQDADRMAEELSDAIAIGDFEPSDWEAEFVDSITEQLADGKTLTETQVEKLTEVYEKALGSDWCAATSKPASHPARRMASRR